GLARGRVDRRGAAGEHAIASAELLDLERPAVGAVGIDGDTERAVAGPLGSTEEVAVGGAHGDGAAHQAGDQRAGRRDLDHGRARLLSAGAAREREEAQEGGALHAGEPTTRERAPGRAAGAGLALQGGGVRRRIAVGLAAAVSMAAGAGEA